MRTSFLVTAALLATTGCTTGDLAYDHTSNLTVDARGLAYTDDESAQLGMYSNTCAIDPDTAAIEEDVDVVEADDEVVDAHEGKALIANATGAKIYDPMGWDWGMDGDYELDFAAPSLQSAGFTADGVVLLDAFQGCNLTFHTDDARQMQLSAEVCDGAVLASSGDSDKVVVGFGGEALIADASGATIALGSADHVALAAADGLVFTAHGTELAAFDLDGVQQWTAELPGDAVALDTLGAHAAVMVAHAAGTGELVTFDATGAVSSSLVTPSPAIDVVGSDSGLEIAMVLPTEVHFFEVNDLN